MDQYEHLASAQIDGSAVTIRNLRRARYAPNAAPLSIDWHDRQVNLDDLKDVWFGLSVFASPGIAHTFLSFDFGDNDPICISVEARQRPGQKYHPFTGLLNEYHLINVVGDELDIIGVRTYSKRNDVHFQPLTLTDDRARHLFLDMMTRTNNLIDTPRHYNTLASNCTSSLLKETIVPWYQRYFDWRLVLAGYSDRVAHQYGVLDQSRSVSDLRRAARLAGGEVWPHEPDFSQKIRAHYWLQLNASDHQQKIPASGD
jgi:hypothetical protein